MNFEIDIEHLENNGYIFLGAKRNAVIGQQQRKKVIVELYVVSADPSKTYEEECSTLYTVPTLHNTWKSSTGKSSTINHPQYSLSLAPSDLNFFWTLKV